MVYESDFYTTRRPYSSRPTITSYSVTTPRHYVVTDTPDRPRRAEEQYSYSYKTESESTSSRPGSSYSSVPSRSYSSSSERVARSTGGGPGSYNYTTERSSSSRSGGGPGSYHASYSSSTSGRLPHGTTYRHFSYHLVPHYGGIVRATPIPLGHSIPYVAHMKLTPHIVAVPNTRTPRSVIYAELDRISHRARPHISYVPKEDFLNDYSIVNFDDETRSIRAQTNSLLRRIHAPVPRSPRPLPISLALTYNRPELAVPERITSDDYIHRMIDHPRDVSYDISVLSYYPNYEPHRVNIGKGHLACVTYAGGRAYPRRREMNYSDNKNIRDEITFRSYYRALDKPGQAAEGTKVEKVAS